MEEKEKNKKYIEENMKMLPEKAQRALCWLVDNQELADQIVGGKKLSETVLARYKKEALEDEDYLMLVLVCYKQIKDHGIL